MSQGAALRHRIAATILDGAAKVLVEHGTSASMADIADGAGVGRATLYRYFPNRESLVQALAAVAVGDTTARLAEADPEHAGLAEGIEAVAVALLEARSKYAILAAELSELDSAAIRQQLSEPLRILLRRGRADGSLRTDLSEDELVAVFGGLLHAAARLEARGGMLGGSGVRQAGRLVRELFLHGAATPPV